MSYIKKGGLSVRVKLPQVGDKRAGECHVANRSSSKGMYIWMTGWAHRLQQKDQVYMAIVNIYYRRGEKSWEMCGPWVSWQNFTLFGEPRKKCLTLVLFGLSL